MKIENWIRRLADHIAQWPIRRSSHIDGFTSRREGAFLYNLARSLPQNAICCEIGIWKGRSAFCIALGLSATAKLIAVDSFDASGEDDSRSIYQNAAGKMPLIEQFKVNMATGGVLGKIEIVQGFSHAVASSVPSNLDMLFIDADHSVEGCTTDYLTYVSKIKIGGYLIFHDYDSSRKDLGPTHVIEKIVLPSGQFDFAERVDRLWVATRAR